MAALFVKEGAAYLIQQNVFRLDITVNDAHGVQVLQCFSDCLSEAGAAQRPPCVVCKRISEFRTRRRRLRIMFRNDNSE